MDGVVAGVVKFLGVEGLLGCEFGLTATFSPSGPRGVQPVAGVGEVDRDGRGTPAISTPP